MPPELAPLDKDAPFTIGIMAYNEEACIAECVRAALRGAGSRCTSVVLVASGCTDTTVERAIAASEGDPRLQLVIEPERLGKAHAINVFLELTTEPICVLMSGDIVVSPEALPLLVEAVTESGAAMAGGRPVPTNPDRGLVNRAVHLQWELHHRLARARPKCGEVIAFRRLFESIDSHTTTDEPSIEYNITAAGGQLTYVPHAIVYNHGPQTFLDLVRIRSRYYAGHRRLRERCGYAPATMDLGLVLKVLARSYLEHPAYMLRYGTTLLVAELLGRLHGSLGLAFRPRVYDSGLWEPIRTSKQRVAPNGSPPAVDEAFPSPEFRIQARADSDSAPPADTSTLAPPDSGQAAMPAESS